MTMYLHILNHAGENQAVLNTRQKLTHSEVAVLAYLIQNPRYTLKGNESEFQGVGVLSTFRDLNKISRFSESGLIKVEHIPRQLRGEELLSFLNKMVTKVGAPKGLGQLTPPWSSSTNPIKASSVTQEQITWAVQLKEQGVSYRKVATTTGIPFGSLHKLMNSTEAV